jgi:hypothetical protein
MKREMEESQQYYEGLQEQEDMDQERHEVMERIN